VRNSNCPRAPDRRLHCRGRKDKATGKENNIRIEGNGQLSEEEIEKMRNEALENEAEDKLVKEKIDKINQADSMIFNTEKQLKEFGEKLSEENKTSIEESLTKLKEAHSSQDLDKIDSAMEMINESWSKASSEMYSQSEQPNQPNESNSNNNDDDNIDDVDFEEVTKDE